MFQTLRKGIQQFLYSLFHIVLNVSQMVEQFEQFVSNC